MGIGPTNFYSVSGVALRILTFIVSLIVAAVYDLIDQIADRRADAVSARCAGFGADFLHAVFVCAEGVPDQVEDRAVPLVGIGFCPRPSFPDRPPATLAFSAFVTFAGSLGGRPPASWGLCGVILKPRKPTRRVAAQGLEAQPRQSVIVAGLGMRPGENKASRAYRSSRLGQRRWIAQEGHSESGPSRRR